MVVNSHTYYRMVVNFHTFWLLWTLCRLLVFINYRLFLEEFKILGEIFFLKFIKILLSVSSSIKLSCVRSRHYTSFLNFNNLTKHFGTYKHVWNYKYTCPFESAFRFSSKTFAPEHSIFCVFVYLYYTSGPPVSAVYCGREKIGKLKK